MLSQHICSYTLITSDISAASPATSPVPPLCATAWWERNGVSRWDDKTLQSHSVLPPHPVENACSCRQYLIIMFVSSSFSSDLPIEDYRMPVPVADSCRRHGILITPYKRNGVERSVGWRRRSSGGVSETRYYMATLWRVFDTRSHTPSAYPTLRPVGLMWGY